MDRDSVNGKLDFLLKEAEVDRPGTAPRVATDRVSSKTTRRFWDLYDALPPEIQQLAVRNYGFWRADRSIVAALSPFERRSALYTVRIGEHYRALGNLSGDTITRVWAGNHSGYDRLVG